MPTETTPTLWCVHVLGPDELHATDSREAAFEQAEALNAAIAEHNAKQGWLDAPLCKATVAVWPWSAESHAADLAAAAPDLLDTLKWFINDLSAEHSSMAEFDDNVARAKAAIAKAEGNGHG